jgi:DNA-binding LacI/PurR family transcriptional regulator
VINGSTSVNDELRERVLAAVRELGYVPNSAARALVTRRTGSVALVVSEPPTRAFSDDPFFPIVIRRVSQELEEADKQVVLMLAGSQRSHARIENYLSGGHVDGVILLSMHGADPLPAALTRMPLPVVSYGRPAVPVDLPFVDNDNVGGAVSAVQHLLERGRSRIATIAGPPDMIGGQDRLVGYRQALGDADRRSIVAVGDFTRESGAIAMRQLLTDDPGLDAVFAANDLMAIGALRTLREAGRRVPDDIAVVGFDDSEAAKFTDPPLTTVTQPIAEQAAAAVRLLLDPGGDHHLILPSELVVRAST